MAVWSCGSFCKLASSSITNQTGFCPGCGMVSSRITNKSIQSECNGRSVSRSGGRDVMKIHPLRSLAQVRAFQTGLPSLFSGQQPEALATSPSEERDTGALRPGLPVDVESHLGSLDALHQFRIARHPLGELVGRRPQLEQMGENLRWRLMKNSSFSAVAGW